MGKGSEAAITAVDLFAGSGGLSLGLQQAGIEVLAAFENWSPAVETYRSNFEHEVHALDLGEVDQASTAVAQYASDCIVGGPPCQDFSSAGKRSEATRADLTVSFAEIVSTTGSEFFIMENVERARRSVAYAMAAKILRDRGYGLSERVLDASLCGVPQKRKRFFVLGRLGAPEGWADKNFDSLTHHTRTTMRQYFGDELTFDYYYRHPRNYSRRGIFSVDEPAPTVRGVSRPVPPGYPGHPGDPVPVTDQLQPLTTFWRSRIQTFPREFQWKGNKTEVEQMIGNAVPVGLGRFVGTVLLAAIADRRDQVDLREARQPDSLVAR